MDASINLIHAGAGTACLNDPCIHGLQIGDHFDQQLQDTKNQ